MGDAWEKYLIERETNQLKKQVKRNEKRTRTTAAKNALTKMMNQAAVFSSDADIMSTTAGPMTPGSGGVMGARTSRNQRKPLGSQKSGYNVLAEIHAREYMSKNDKQSEFELTSNTNTNTNSRNRQAHSSTGNRFTK